MTNVSWTDSNDDNANWTTASDWSTGVVPGASDDVTIPSGAPEISSNVGTIDSLTLEAEANLYIESGSGGAPGALAVTGDLTTAGYLGIGDQGGTQGASLSVGGALTNTGLMNLGNGAGNQGAVISLTVGSFNNEGTIENSGGGTYGQLSLNSYVTNDEVVMNVQSAAGFGQTGMLMGVVTLQYNAEIDFQSGQITTIEANSQLSLYGADASINNAGTFANSALTGLTTIAGQLDVQGGATVSTGEATQTAGAFTVGNDVSVSGYLDANTIIIANGGDLAITGAFSYQDSLTIEAGGTLEFGASGGSQAGYSGPMDFAGSGSGTATLQVDGAPTNGQTGSETLVGFGQNDALYLSGMTYAPGATATLSGGVLTVISNGVTENFDVTNPGATSFQATDDNGGVLVTAVCFCSGTLIRTARGEVAVEDLRVGDLAVTSEGMGRPIIWIGSKLVERPSRPQWPVRVLAGAFGDGLPKRDLWLSPGHAVCLNLIEEVFVPVGELVNGATIAQVEVSEVTYWHVELESHDVLLAEGLPTESYMDAGNRAFFGREYGRLEAIDPERANASLAAYARPFVNDAASLEAIRRRLVARAHRLGWARSDDIDVHLILDGRRLDPVIAGSVACFAFPAEAGSARLCSRTFSPAWTGESKDRRELGVCLRSLRLGDGRDPGRQVSLGEIEGFHPEEAATDAAWRWTSGELPLPCQLWEQHSGLVVLTLAFDAAAGWAWRPPLAASGAEVAVLYAA